MQIIKLKNQISYDPNLGGITTTFFPVSILMVPLLIPLLVIRSERLSDIVLKVQYGFMMAIYVFVSVIISAPILPLLYIKIICNALYIACT